MPHFGNFNQKCLISLFLGKNFKYAIVVFESNILKFVYLQSLTRKLKCLNLESEMPDLGIFGIRFENIIVIFEISTLEFV